MAGAWSRPSTPLTGHQRSSFERARYGKESEIEGEERQNGQESLVAPDQKEETRKDGRNAPCSGQQSKGRGREVQACC
jgi:hypothetical protein